MKRETFKTLIIFLLTGLAAFLLSGLWLEDIFTLSTEKNQSIENIDLGHLITVEELVVNFGGGRSTSYFQDKDDIFRSFQADLLQAISNISEKTPIDAEEYYALRVNKSIEFQLATGLKHADVQAILTSKATLPDKDLGVIYSLLVLARESKSVWVRTEEGYFELLLSTSISDVDSLVDALASDPMAVTFQSVSQRFSLPSFKDSNGLERYNHTLIPKLTLPVVLPIQVQRAYDTDSIDSLRTLAKNVFGNKLNFVQEAVDVNGGKVFIYGYGDKALRISKTGIIEYTETLDKQIQTDTTLVESLSSALAMLERLGGNSERFFIKRIDAQLASEGVYIFEFGYKINGYPVIDTDGISGARVELSSGHVRKLYRNTYIYDAYMGLSKQQSMQRETDDAQFFNMLNTNFLEIEALYFKDRDLTTLNSIERSHEVLNAISNIQVGYYLDSAQIMQPAIIITLGEGRIVIDFYTYQVVK